MYLVLKEFGQGLTYSACGTSPWAYVVCSRCYQTGLRFLGYAVVLISVLSQDRGGHVLLGARAQFQNTDLRPERQHQKKSSSEKIVETHLFPNTWICSGCLSTVRCLLMSAAATGSGEFFYAYIVMLAGPLRRLPKLCYPTPCLCPNQWTEQPARHEPSI